MTTEKNPYFTHYLRPYRRSREVTYNVFPKRAVNPKRTVTLPKSRPIMD